MNSCRHFVFLPVIVFVLEFLTFLGAFAKISKSDQKLRYVCPSVRMEQLGFHWTDFHEIWYYNIFRKSVQKIQVSLKSDNNNRYFTCGRPIYIIVHISLNSSYDEKCFKQKL